MHHIVSVIGPSSPGEREASWAYKVGFLLGSRGYAVATGGLTGIMEEALRGAHDAGAITIGVLPGENSEEANPYVDIPLATGLGELRNFLLIKIASGVISISLSPGTLSEIGLALRMRKPYVALGLPEGFPLDVKRVSTPEEAVTLLSKMMGV